jgi:hypothetical protein
MARSGPRKPRSSRLSRVDPQPVLVLFACVPPLVCAPYFGSFGEAVFGEADSAESRISTVGRRSLNNGTRYPTREYVGHPALCPRFGYNIYMNIMNFIMTLREWDECPAIDGLNV